MAILAFSLPATASLAAESTRDNNKQEPYADAIIQVTATAQPDGITEGTGSYTTHISNTASKLNLSPRETPQTLTVITRQKMDDFALTDIDKVLSSTSTVSILQQGGDGAFYFSRGFRLQNQYDGMPNPIGIGENNRGPSPDTAFLDKVEILQGASGLMSGAGDPGGTINLVRKRPTEDFKAHIEAEPGSWKKKRLAGDVSGSLIASGRIRGRAVALVDHRDSFIDYAYDNKQGFYGIVDADVTSTTTVSASVIYQKNDLNYDLGIPMGSDGADLGLPRSVFYGYADGGVTRKTTSYTLNIEQKLPRDWSLKAAYTHTDTTVDAAGGWLDGTLNPITGSGLSLSQVLQQRKFKSNIFDLYASGSFQLFDRKHELVMGATSAEMKSKNRLAGFTTISIPNIYNYDGASISPPSGSFSDWPAADKTTQQGVYGAVRLNLTDSLKAILGTRVSWYENKDDEEPQKENAVVSPYAGLIFDINNSTSIYASYSDIFKPQSELKFGGGTLDPVVGKNYEMGVKSEFPQGRLNASAAVFRLEQTNLPQVDTNVSPLKACNGGYCYTAAERVVSQGIDLGLNGELLPGWQIGAGYSLVNSKYGSNDVAYGIHKGDPYNSYLPRQILRVYTTYLIPGTDWIIGGNIRTQSRVYTQKPTFRIEQGGYTTVGLMAKYQIKEQTEISLMVNNLFDRRYYESIGSYGTNIENFYGAPRNFTVNLKYTF